ncbi:MAG: hypothetical protein JWM54_19 [Acidobacteriaceae bacterium]|jgi:hypothetical protein|nr:hypothetical protein [Acidobacteriaceae bacterium]
MHKGTIAAVAGLCLFAVGAKAQDTHPPKVLVVDVEYLKLDKVGTPHDKSEAVLAKIAADAKSPLHYIGMQSLTGVPRALFFFPFDSFAEYGKEMVAGGGQSEVAAKIEQANAEDAGLLTSKETGVYTYRPDLSHKPDAPLKSLHFWEITRVRVKVGHTQDWEEYLKILSSALDKSDPDRALAVYQSAYGTENGGLWVILAPIPSINALDHLFELRAGMAKSMDPGTLKRYRELAEASVDHSQRNLFASDPEMSYVWDDWVKGDSFWQKKGQ